MEHLLQHFSVEVRQTKWQKSGIRQLICVLSLQLLLLILPTSLKADTTTSIINGLKYTLDSETKTASVALEDKTLTKVIILDYVEYKDEKYYVTEIAEKGFSGSGIDLEEVIIGNSVEIIGNEAFYEQMNLQHITIPQSVKTISERAFFHSGLIELTIPENVTLIEEKAFFYCYWLKTLNYNAIDCDTGNERLTFIDRGKGIEKLTIGENVKVLPNSVFVELSGITEVTIGKAVKTIGSDAFKKCKNLESIYIPDSVTIIGDGAFSYTGLIECVIPDTVINMGRNVFESCVKLEKCSLPNSLTEIKTSTFAGCKLLKEVKIPNNIVCINDFAFQNCSSLESIDIPASVKTIGYRGFYCSGLTMLELPESLVTLGSESFHGCVNLKSIIFPPALESVNYSTFGMCSSLTEVVIPSSLKGLSQNMFANCTSLQRVVLQRGLESISENSFLNCQCITQITIPETVNRINSSSFSGTSIRKVYYNAINCNVGYSASVFPTCLEEVTVGDEVEYIPEGLFYGRKNLATVILGNSVTTIRSSAFKDCTALNEITLPISLITISSNAFVGCTGLTSITIPDNVISIGNNAFSGCSNLETVYFNAENCTKMGVSTSKSFSSTVKNVIFGKAVKQIPSWAFYECSLKEVNIPVSVISIGESAFRDCSILTVVSIPHSVLQLSRYTFSGCTNLDNVTIPGSIREIGEYAFHNCTALSQVKVINPIPPVIYSSTFEKCPTTISLYVPKGSETLFLNNTCWCKFDNIHNIDYTESFNVDNIAYYITSEDYNTVEVSAVNINSRVDVGDLVVPSEITFDSKTYQVTGISNNGFEGGSITSVRLPETINYVGIEAFKDVALTGLFCTAGTPPSASVSSFDNNTYQQAMLTVKKESLNVYKQDGVWKNFVNINPPILIQSLTLTPELIEAKAGTQFQITANILPETASDKRIEWHTSDDSVATIDQTGLLTILRKAECTVTAHTIDGSNLVAECKLVINTDIGTVPADSVEENTTIYDMNGLLISTSVESLSEGIYIVREGATMRKIVVK